MCNDWWNSGLSNNTKKSKKHKRKLVVICGVILFSILLISQLLQPKKESEALSVLAGYYWSGMVDQRERLTKDEETAYREDYLALTDSKKRVFDARYNWIEVGAVSAKHVENGAYVHVYFTGSILETYPAKLQEVARIAVVSEE